MAWLKEDYAKRFNAVRLIWWRLIYSSALSYIFLSLSASCSLSPEADTNPWLQQSLTAARKKKCGEFYCTKKTEDIYEEEQDDEYAAGDQIDDSLTSVDTVSRNLEAENVSQQPTS